MIVSMFVSAALVSEEVENRMRNYSPISPL